MQVAIIKYHLQIRYIPAMYPQLIFQISSTFLHVLLTFFGIIIVKIVFVIIIIIVIITEPNQPVIPVSHKPGGIPFDLNHRIVNRSSHGDPCDQYTAADCKTNSKHNQTCPYKLIH